MLPFLRSRPPAPKFGGAVNPIGRRLCAAFPIGDELNQRLMYVIETRQSRHLIAVAVLAYMTKARYPRRSSHGKDQAGITGSGVINDRLQLRPRLLRSLAQI